MGKRAEVMVVDDESIVCERLQEHFAKEGLLVETFTESAAALRRLTAKAFDVVVTDLKMKAPDGLDLLHHVRRTSPGTKVIIITGYTTIEAEREAEYGGVFEFVSKPFKVDKLTALVKKAAAKAQKGSRPTAE